MTDLDALLDAAEQEPKPSMTVNVCVIPSIAVERAKLLAALDRAVEDDALDEETDGRLGAVAKKVTDRADVVRAELAKFDKKSKKALITLKFTPMDGYEWAQLTSAHPRRIEVPLDLQYGYDYDAVSKAAAIATGVMVTDAGEVPISEEQWGRLFKKFSGRDVEEIRDAVWLLNEYQPALQVEALVKGFGAA